MLKFIKRIFGGDNKPPMGCVYAGPDMFDNKKFGGVYAGPEYFNKKEKEPENEEIDELPTYPAQYEEKKANIDNSKMMLIYAAPGPEGDISSRQFSPEQMNKGMVNVPVYNPQLSGEEVICSLCGAKASGKFCINCGAVLEVKA